MSSDVIVDNWSLQDISRLLHFGMDDDNTHLIKPNVDKGTHEYTEIPAAIIQTEALFDFLTDIILRDQLLVEEQHVDAWKREASPLEVVDQAGIIRAYPFRSNFKLDGPRAEFVNRLCITESLRTEHDENTEGWRLNRRSPHQYLSQTLWGGAGMLARSFVTEHGYTPHPVRRNFFQKSGLVLRNEDSLVCLNSKIKEKRASVYKSISGSDEFYSLYVNMMPLPIQVIQESSSHADLITTALQLRDEYKELRNWLGCYQAAINNDDFSEIKHYQEILRSISKYVDSKMGVTDPNAPTFSAGIGIFKMAIKGDLLNTIRNQFGVRSMVNKLILSKSGTADLKKYLGFFDQKKSVVGMKVIEHFSS
ncbi:MAG: hypothetical protein WC236_07460 [Gallionellaceae bacterium]